MDETAQRLHEKNKNNLKLLSKTKYIIQGFFFLKQYFPRYAILL